MPCKPAISVIKIGGSVLTGAAAYRRAAAFVAVRLSEIPGERLVVVVSAEHGQTDALLAEARDLCADPDPAALDLLWSTGELRSVARLTLALHALGVRALPANVHQTGIVVDETSVASTVRPLRLLAALGVQDVVVAPGFLARSGGDGIASLGRGGADLSAVLLAAGLRARRCELVKDVAGYFSADPNRAATATHVPALSWTDALHAADSGCALVQRQALEVARRHALPVVIRALGSDTRATVIGDFAAARPNPPCECTA